MDRFARAHWNDSFSPSRATLSIQGDVLQCALAGERFEGEAAAPLSFLAGAWALIHAHENDGRHGHRIGGRLNRIWPHGVSVSSSEHGLDEQALVWTALWPGTLFSSELYRGAGTPGHPHWPRSLSDAPRRTSLAGIMKRAVATADDADPLERLKVAEFVLYNLSEWSATAEDLMMDAIGAPLMRLSRDPEPATREVACLALEACAFRCWWQRAYGLYEPLCERLLELGWNAHLQYARLTESAYAAGRIEAGDRLWQTASAGIDPTKAVRLSAAHDHIGDWSDLETRLLRQSGGANVGWMAGNDPNPARQARRAKRNAKPPAPAAAAGFRELARTLLQRAALHAEARMATDLAALRQGSTVRVGGGELDPGQRRLFLAEIPLLQSHLAAADGDADERLRLLFKAMAWDWELQGRREGFHSDYDELAFELVQDRTDADLAALGMPACFAARLAHLRADQALTTNECGRERLAWRRLLSSVFEQLLDKHAGDDYERIPADDLASGFDFARDGLCLTLIHPALAAPIVGDVREPLRLALRAWNAAIRACMPGADGACVVGPPYFVVTLAAEDLPLWAALARQAHSQGDTSGAIALYRCACGTDPIVQPWPYRDPVPPLPMQEVPEALRAEVAARRGQEAVEATAKTKPRGRRIEQLAAACDPDDPVSARYLAQGLREACDAGESEIVRVLKAAQPLLLRLLAHPQSAVRDGALLASIALLQNVRRHAPGWDAQALRAAVLALDVVGTGSIVPQRNSGDSTFYP